MEESLLSTDYKKHIQVQGPVASAVGCQGGEPGVLAQSQGCFSDGPWEGGWSRGRAQDS